MDIKSKPCKLHNGNLVEYLCLKKTCKSGQKLACVQCLKNHGSHIFNDKQEDQLSTMPKRQKYVLVQDIPALIQRNEQKMVVEQAKLFQILELIYQRVSKLKQWFKGELTPHRQKLMNDIDIFTQTQIFKAFQEAIKKFTHDKNSLELGQKLSSLQPQKSLDRQSIDQIKFYIQLQVSRRDFLNVDLRFIKEIQRIINQFKEASKLRCLFQCKQDYYESIKQINPGYQFDFQSLNLGTRFVISDTGFNQGTHIVEIQLLNYTIQKSNILIGLIPLQNRDTIAGFTINFMFVNLNTGMNNPSNSFWVNHSALQIREAIEQASKNNNNIQLEIKFDLKREIFQIKNQDRTINLSLDNQKCRLWKKYQDNQMYLGFQVYGNQEVKLNILKSF